MISELAEEFQVTKRQVHRDLRQLEDSGYPLEQEDGRWRLPVGFKGLEITVSPYELMSLHLAKSHVAYLRGTPFLDDLETVVRKVEAGLSDRVKNHLGRIVTTFAPLQRPVRAYATKKEILGVLRTALLRQRTTVLRGYHKPGAEQPIDYCVDPYTLVQYQYGVYLVGYSYQANDLRIFAVERIQAIDLTDKRFEIPTSFSLEERFARGFGLIDGELQDVKIWISPEWAISSKNAAGIRHRESSSRRTVPSF